MTDTPPSSSLVMLDRCCKFGIASLILLSISPALLSGSFGWITELAFHIPIAVFLLTLNPRAPRRYAWLCFVVLAYFCSTVLDAFMLPTLEGITGLAASLTTVVIFIASMIASRKSEHWMRAESLKNA